MRNQGFGLPTFPWKGIARCWLASISLMLGRANVRFKPRDDGARNSSIIIVRLLQPFCRLIGPC